jgi:Ser/Thr protein kinase RdoA (MazF antagonist)
MCHNYRLTTDRGVYFLKQYRNKISTVVHEIKFAEEYFASQGLPVLLPVEDRHGRKAFWLDGHWLSVFSFIEASTPQLKDVDLPLVTNLGEMLARFHEAGRKFDYWHFQPLRLWDRRKFFMEFIELEHEILRREPRTELDQRILEVLRQKAELVRRNAVDPHNIPLAYDCLLHGDFIYPNTFVTPSHEVTHVYDLEKAAIGPRAYELARSIFINCFDDGCEDKNYEFGRAFLTAYRRRLPISFDEFSRGVQLYVINLQHMNWIESRYLIYGIDTQLALYERHAKRLQWVLREGEHFAERVYK